MNWGLKLQLKPDDFYIVIRSANERSVPLCLKSVRSLGIDHEVININPFWKAVIKTFEIGINRGKRFTVGLDADIVLYKNAIDTFIRVVSKMPGYWKYDFGLKDRFYPGTIWGVHVYDTTVLPIALKNLPKNIQTIPKPERQFCYELKKEGYNDITIPDIAGEHGYNQYYRDIFNRFFHRAIRNPPHKKRIFKDIDNIRNDPEFLIALLGWEEGEAFIRRHRLKMRIKKLLFLSRKTIKRRFLPKDFEKNKNIRKYLKKFGLNELEPLEGEI